MLATVRDTDRLEAAQGLSVTDPAGHFGRQTATSCAANVQMGTTRGRSAIAGAGGPQRLRSSAIRDRRAFTNCATKATSRARIAGTMEQDDRATPYEGDAPFLFVSYSRMDRVVVTPIIRALAAQGVRLWWDGGLSAGAHFPSQIERKICGCAGVLVFLSRHSTAWKAENWVLEETRLAARQGKDVIPIRCDSTELPLDWKVLVGSRHWIAIEERCPDRCASEIRDHTSHLGVHTTHVEMPRGAADRTRGAQMPLWASTCLELLERIQRLVRQRRLIEPEELRDLEVSWEEEDDAPWLGLPLEADQSPALQHCSALLAESHGLSDSIVPFPQRLASGINLIEIMRAARDETRGEFLATHLIVITAVLRLFVEVAREPDATVTRAIERAEHTGFLVSPSRSALGISRAESELLEILDFSIEALRLEVLLVADPPSAQAIDNARRIGHLAYDPEWAERLRQSRRLELRAYKYHWSSDFAEPTEDKHVPPVLRELIRMWEHGWRLCGACQFLRAPLRPPSEEEVYRYQSRPHSFDHLFDEHLNTRAAWRMLDLLDRASSQTQSPSDEGLAALLSSCIGGASAMRDACGVWATSALAPCPTRLLKHLASIPKSHNGHFQPYDLAAIFLCALDRDSASTIDPHRYSAVAELCFHRAAVFSSRLTTGDIDRGEFKDWATKPVQAILWFLAIGQLASSRSRTDAAACLAHAYDPECATLKDGLALHRRVFGADESRTQTERALESLRAAEARVGPSPRFGKRVIARYAAARGAIASKLVSGS